MPRATSLLALLSIAAAPVTTTAGAAEIDWTRGLVIVRAIGTADRRAPGPGVARIGAAREADQRAAEALAAAAKQLVGADVAAELVVEVETELLPDGSVRGRRGLPVEAIRQAVHGVRTVTPDWTGAAPPTDAGGTLVIDARNLEVAPRVGIGVNDGAATIIPPAIWVTEPPADATPRLAERLDGDALVVTGGAPLDPGALLVVVVRETP